MALRTPFANDAKTYGFEWLRAQIEASLQEGVIGSGDLKITAAAAGGMRADVAAGQALVKGDSGVAATGLSQGLYLVVNDAAIANVVTFTAADATNARVDQVTFRVRDSADLGSAADDAVIEVYQGTATAGATLDNRSGAAALPNDAIRLADVLIPAGSSAVAAGNVRDRRPWARGFRFTNRRTTDYNTGSSTSVQDVDTSLLQVRAELSAGNPVEVSLAAAGAAPYVSTVGQLSSTFVLVAGAVAGTPSTGYPVHAYHQAVRAGNYDPVALSQAGVFLPGAAGSHIVKAQAQNGAAGGSLNINAGNMGIVMRVRELVGADANNGLS